MMLLTIHKKFSLEKLGYADSRQNLPLKRRCYIIHMYARSPVDHPEVLYNTEEKKYARKINPYVDVCTIVC